MLLFIRLCDPLRHTGFLLLSVVLDICRKGAAPNARHLFGHLPEHLLELPT